MSTKASNQDNNQNGWDLDDDNWDDWGDAEDTMPEISNTPKEEQTKSTNLAQKIIQNNNRNAREDTIHSQLMENNNSVQERQSSEQQTQRSSGWGSLFGGVVSNVLTKANEITTTVTNGLDRVIGVPDPEEMARINAIDEARREKAQQENPTDPKHEADSAENKETSLTPVSNSAFGLHLVSGVQTLGSKVLNTGLDTLEGIGKKTMTMLQDNDPMIKNKIKKLGLEQDKPDLSEILKEAKKENERLEESLKELNIEKTRAKLRFEVLFEEYTGLVHLEALEMLSNESNIKIKVVKDSVSGKALEELLETINEVKELMELEDLECEPESEDYNESELEETLMQSIEDAELNIKFDEITSLWSSCLKWLSSDESKNSDADAVFAKGIHCISQTCAMEILKLHKIAELMLVKEHHSTANEVDAIVQLCKQFCIHLQVVANHFASLLTTSHSEEQQQSQSYTSKIFSEMLEARQQIEKAFNLFLPIIQMGAI